MSEQQISLIRQVLSHDELTSSRSGPTRSTSFHDSVHVHLRPDIHVRQAFYVYSSRFILVD